MVNGEEQSGNPADYHPDDQDKITIAFLPDGDADPRAAARGARRPPEPAPTCSKVRADAPARSSRCQAELGEDRLAGPHEQPRGVGGLATRHRALGAALPARQLLGRGGPHSRPHRRRRADRGGPSPPRRRRRRAAPSPARSSGFASTTPAAQQRQQPQLGELVRAGGDAARPSASSSSRAVHGLGRGASVSTASSPSAP